MQKKVGIVDNDSSFVRRFKDVISSKHTDVEVFVFPNIKAAQTAAKKFELNLLLVDSKVGGTANFTLPMQCSAVLLSNEREDKEDCSLPTICKYRSVEEWYEVICKYCRCDDGISGQGGGNVESQKSYAPICLFLPCGENTGATIASTSFCHFLYENGFGKMAVFEPYFESGEDLWRAVDTLREKCNGVCVALNNWDYENSIVPIINAAMVVLVSDGTTIANETIKKYLHEIPKVALESREDINRKTYILYNNFDPKSGSLFESNDIGKLGGLGEGRNNKASFEKLVTILGVRRD